MEWGKNWGKVRKGGKILVGKEGECGDVGIEGIWLKFEGGEVD